MIISIVNRSSSIPDEEVQRVLRAINRQIAEDFEPYWSFGAQLRLEGAIDDRPSKRRLDELRGDAILYLYDKIDVADAIGYHERNWRGIPYGFVSTKVADNLHEEWTTTLSHEALELLADAQNNLLVQGPHPDGSGTEVYHWFEMCDAVQDESYQIDGVNVSNFVLPSYFTPGEQSGARNDFLGRPDARGQTLRSFGVKPGGYVGFFNPGTGRWDQWSRPDDARAAARRKVKAAAGIGRSFMRQNGGPADVPNEDRHRQALASGLALTTRADAAPSAAPAADADFDHVIVLMLENRSFDHMLGALTNAGIQVDGLANAPRTNPSLSGQAFAQSPTAPDRINVDPPHEFTDTAQQVDNGAMDGFVRSYEQACTKAGHAPSDSDRAQVMSYFDVGQQPQGDKLPVLHALARRFVVCDRWFASLPGPTWPNRSFIHSGTSHGVITMPSSSDPELELYPQETVYNRLEAAGRSWRIYHHQMSQTVVFPRLLPYMITSRYRDFENFADDVRTAGTDFPAYVFIEPDYFGADRSDQHPPGSVNAGEALIASVYNALHDNPQLFDRTLLVVVWDEHGGFFDHVAPPPTVAPDDCMAPSFKFDRLGVRVPALLVSPRLQGGVCSVPFDHTSVLRYVCEKWNLPMMGLRAAQANSIAKAFQWAPASTAIPGPLRAGDSTAATEDLDVKPMRADDALRARAVKGPKVPPPPQMAVGSTKSLRQADLDQIDDSGMALIRATEQAARRSRLLIPATSHSDGARLDAARHLFGLMSKPPELGELNPKRKQTDKLPAPTPLKRRKPRPPATR